MGGGGSSYSYSGLASDELEKKISDSKDKTKLKQFESEVESEIQDSLSDINSRDSSKTNARLQEINKLLEGDIDGVLNINFGGSIAKHTYVDGMSDVDCLVFLNDSELSDKNPEEVREYFSSLLKKRFPSTEVSVGSLAVTVKFTDVEIQLLPALKYASGVKIATADGEKWSNIINPKRFAKKLTDINSKHNNKVVPVIKLAKYIISKNLPEGQRLSGYHIESLAIEIFSNYSGADNPKEMLNHFFNSAPKYINHKISDSTGQSRHIDDYLGENDSVERKMCSNRINRIGQKIRNANIAMSLEQWKDIIGG